MGKNLECPIFGELICFHWFAFSNPKGKDGIVGEHVSDYIDVPL